jgi:hypothetical protein
MGKTSGSQPFLGYAIPTPKFLFFDTIKNPKNLLWYTNTLYYRSNTVKLGYNKQLGAGKIRSL